MSNIKTEQWHDHRTGEANRQDIINKLKPEDLDHLERLVVPTLSAALRRVNAQAALFIVGSLADRDLSTYRDIDLHLVAHDPRCDARRITAELERTFMAEKRLSTYVNTEFMSSPDGGDIKTVIFTGVEARFLGIPQRRFQGAYFEILAPLAWIPSYLERLADERASGDSFCLWSENV